MSQAAEQPLENITASILLKEFRDDMRFMHEEYRKDIRSIEAKIDMQSSKIDAKIDAQNAKIDAQNAKIDNNFKWLVGIQFATALTIVGTILSMLLPLVLAK